MFLAKRFRAGRSVVVTGGGVERFGCGTRWWLNGSADRVSPLTYKLTLSNSNRFYPRDIIPAQLFDVKDQIESRNGEQFTDMIAGIDDLELVTGVVETPLDLDEDAQP